MSDFPVCPECGSDQLQRVRFTWWGGLLGPLLFKQVHCPACGTKYLIRAQRSAARRMVGWSVAGVIALLIAGVVGGIVYLGTVAPDTKVLPGPQVPKRFVDRIRGLGVLEPNEQIDFFYSDALLNIEEGFYLVTDRKVVVYSDTYDEPAILVPYDEIVGIDAEYNDGWAEDSLITIERADGSVVTFPASNEADGDERIVEILQARTARTQPAI